MSNINYSAIQTNYPVVGQDNSSQGFRDNFSAIALGLETAKTEITTLQTNGIFAADITNSTPTPIINNLLGSVLYNGATNLVNSIFYTTTTPATGNIQVDLANGPVQKYTVSGNVIFSFIHWPSPSAIVPGLYTTVRLMLIGDQRNGLTNNGQPYTVGFNNTTGHIYQSISGYTPITIAANGEYAMVEITTFDAGSNIFIRTIGNDFARVS